MTYKQTWIAAAGGALVAAWGLSRRSYTGLAVAIGGGCVAYWASTGRWPAAMRSAVGVEPREVQAPGPQTGTDPRQPQWYPPPNVDPIEEASMDSFPASDPPSYMSSSATPSRRPE